jgi:maltooligosyltrehalose trehalohydrolase
VTALLPLGDLGAVENNGVVTFGLWLPWVSANDGNRVSVKIIHEHDQFLQNIPPRECQRRTACVSRMVTSGRPPSP